MYSTGSNAAGRWPISTPVGCWKFRGTSERVQIIDQIIDTTPSCHAPAMLVMLPVSPWPAG